MSTGVTMKFETISYKRTKNLGNYENEVLELTAQINETDDPDLVTLELRDRVNQQLGISESVKELKNDQILLEQQNAQLEANIAAATERWNRIQQFMEKLGINLKNVPFVDDIPF